ncbi:MAG: hypothetical protein AB6733_17240 [Clostridiaceae bacterium]
MNTHFKSALDQVKAEEELLTKTEKFLKDQINKSESTKKNILISRREFFMSKRLAFAIGLAVILVGGGGGSAYAYYQTPQSYVSIDINPSVELGVNAFDKVVDVQAYNTDGEQVLEGLDVEGDNVTEAVNEIVAAAEENGYVLADGSTVVSVTAETDDEELATELEEEAEAGATDALEESGATAVISKDNVALARRDEARELGITPGKLNLINKLQAVDPTATVEQYKDASVKEIMKAIKEIKHNNKVSDETQDETTTEDGTTTENQATEDQTEVTNETENTESNVTQEEAAKQSQEAETKEKQDKEKNKAQGNANNQNQGNANNNAKNGNNGKGSNKDK